MLAVRAATGGAAQVAPKDEQEYQGGGPVDREHFKHLQMRETASRRGLKAGIDADDARSRRVEAKIELRKVKKDDVLSKRRNFAAVEHASTLADDLGQSAAPMVADIPVLARDILEYVRNGCRNDQTATTLQTIIKLRKLLSIPDGPPIDEVLSAGLAPAFVELLTQPSCGVSLLEEDQRTIHVLTFEAAWCLTNLASGTTSHCRAVIDAGAIPPLLGLLSSPSVDAREQAVWCISNIAGDCAAYRDALLSCGAMPRVIEMIERTAVAGQLTPLRNATWALSNLVRGKPAPSRDHVLPALPTLAKLLHLDDAELSADTVWALAYIAEADSAFINSIVEAGCVPRMLHHLEFSVQNVQVPALRALSNMLTGSDESTQAVLDGGFMRIVHPFVTAERTRTRKEACWALSNIAAGTPLQVDALMSSPLLVAVVDRLGTDEYDVKKEALWTVVNILHAYKTEPSIRNATRASALAQVGVIAPLVKMLEVADVSVLQLALEACANLLASGAELMRGKSDNPFVVPFDEAEGIEKLEALQEHENATIYDKAVAILEEFFGEDGAEDESLLPNASDGAFTFHGLNSPASAFVF